MCAIRLNWLEDRFGCHWIHWLGDCGVVLATLFWKTGEHFYKPLPDRLDGGGKDSYKFPYKPLSMDGVPCDKMITRLSLSVARTRI